MKQQLNVFRLILNVDIKKHMYLEHFQIVVKWFLVCPKVQYSGQHCFLYILMILY